MSINNEINIGPYCFNASNGELMIAVRGPDGEKETENGLSFIAALEEVLRKAGANYRTYKRHEHEPEERTDVLFIKVLISLVSHHEDT